MNKLTFTYLNVKNWLIHLKQLTQFHIKVFREPKKVEVIMFQRGIDREVADKALDLMMVQFLDNAVKLSKKKHLVLVLLSTWINQVLVQFQVTMQWT